MSSSEKKRKRVVGRPLRSPPLVLPHGWAIGHTFEFTFSLPEPANKGGGSPTRKNPAGTGKSLKKAAPRATKPKQRTAPDPVQTDAKRQNQVEYDRQRNKSPERVEYRRLREQERRRQAKLLGLCKNCSNPAIAGQTRCLSCAEKHRQSRRRNYANRRAAVNETAATQAGLA